MEILLVCVWKFVLANSIDLIMGIKTGAGVSTPERKEIGTEAVAIASSLSHRSSVAVRGSMWVEIFC